MKKISITIEEETLATVDQYRKGFSPIPNRSEGIRWLIREGLMKVGML